MVVIRRWSNFKILIYRVDVEVLVESGHGVLLEVGLGPSVHGVIDTVVQGGSELGKKNILYCKYVQGLCGPQKSPYQVSEGHIVAVGRPQI